MRLPKPTANADIHKIKDKVKSFSDELGRPLKVAHVGNIANNAYLAAKHQRSIGIDAIVFSPDYTHVMGFPEWEECSFSRDDLSGHFTASFPETNFVRPSWFYSGSWGQISENFFLRNPASLQKNNKKSYFSILSSKFFFKLWEKNRGWIKKSTPLVFKTRVVNSILIRLRVLGLNPCQSILESFDVIHFYGPYNYIAAIYDFKTPFVTTEHGTIREYIFTNYYQAKMSKIGYIRSKAVHITNQDSLPYALKLGLSAEAIFFTPHPINQSNFEQLRGLRRTLLPPEYKVIIPARQVKKSDVETGKGNEKVLKAIKLSVDSNLPFRFLIPLWGDDIEYTIDLAKKLGIFDKIDWIPLLSRPKLQSFMIECAAVIDQFNVKAYGAISADALALGVPLITISGEKNDVLVFGTEAPVLNASTSDEIFTHLKNLLSEEFNFLAHLELSINWFERHLTMQIATSRFLDSYKFALER